MMADDRLREGFRLIRAVLKAQQDHTEAPTEQTQAELSKALVALADFEAASPLDYKQLQSGERADG
jgi:hypothetical protein